MEHTQPQKFDRDGNVVTKEELEKRLGEVEDRISEIQKNLEKTIKRAKQFPELPKFKQPGSLADCESQKREIYDLLGELDWKISSAEESSKSANQNIDGAGNQFDKLRKFTNAWDNYKWALQNYRDCLRDKEEAVFSLNCCQRRFILSSRLAVRNILTVASGKTTVPISRPSATT